LSKLLQGERGGRIEKSALSLFAKGLKEIKKKGMSVLSLLPRKDSSRGKKRRNLRRELNISLKMSNNRKKKKEEKGVLSLPR